jgi:hypothetical protein
VCKYVLVPNSETQKKLWDETIRPDDGEDILHRWLQNFHKENDAEYLFQVQLLENLEDQPASSPSLFYLGSLFYNVSLVYAYIIRSRSNMQVKSGITRNTLSRPSHA